ncbi:helix-hairpin-helix domain-containing protein [Paenibacillus sp. P25]|nr:helix-hairpin-helix domain-containing protein [Paenibacillus sp. P25]
MFSSNSMKMWSGAGVLLLCGVLLCLFVWRPWETAEGLNGWKAADDEMRRLLEQQSEMRETQQAAKLQEKKPAEGQKTGKPQEKKPEETPGTSETLQKKGEEAKNAPPSSTVETPKPPAVAAPPSAGSKLNLNRATASQLEEPPGIGASRAKAILEPRERLGGSFARVEQLLEVKGIGSKMLEKLKPHITVEP